MKTGNKETSNHINFFLSLFSDAHAKLTSSSQGLSVSNIATGANVN